MIILLLLIITNPFVATITTCLDDDYTIENALIDCLRNQHYKVFSYYITFKIGGRAIMQLTGIWGGFYRISVWVTRFAWLNLLWVAFTLAGLILLGLLPATFAMFAVVRKWVVQEYDISIVKTFFAEYKSTFVTSNLLGLVLYAIGYILSVFLNYTGLMADSSVYPILFGLFVIAAFFYTVLLLYIAPVYVHYQLTFWQYIRYAVSIGVVNLHYSICALTILTGIYFLSFYLPGITLFFSFSVSAYTSMFIIHIGFNQLLKKQQEQTKEINVSPL
ncbi:MULTISPECIES: YesL family protein [Gracilibacillus]|uniref:YesL family protein n=1 Tax=Gracilibacillus TaxID=74385 RepID=UPI000A6FEA08|nr:MULTISPECIES: DUF624 domain-containing protein [Gracilibacillus]